MEANLNQEATVCATVDIGLDGREAVIPLLSTIPEND
jgi:hypothetical protein